jgi:general secretion pathway protein D
MKRTYVACGVLILLVLASSCDRIVGKRYLSNDIKPETVQKLTAPVKDEEIVVRRPRKNHTKPEAAIPAFMRQKISLSLNETLPIKNVLYETAKKLNIGFQMDPSINTNVIFSARDKPFIEVLDAVCDMSNLRYSIRDNFVSVVRDDPYTATYDMQFLNFSRDSENKISIATEVSSGALQDPGQRPSPSPLTKSSASAADTISTASPSDSNVTVKTKNDFWAELENGIKVILGSKKETTYSINKQSGIVTISANSKEHKSIREHINMIKRATESQVLIEAKIIEVSLKNEYKRGIDWSIVGDKINIRNPAYNSGQIFSTISTGTSASMNVILNTLESFGSTRTISNPRITAMNNQAAVLKVAQNHVYFRLNYDKTYSLNENGRDNTSVSSDIRTVPIGLVMFVQPSIDLNSDTITLFLRPTISKLSGTVSDPAVDIAIRSMDSKDKINYEPSRIPITEVREVSSVLKLKDGEIAVLGGFMEVRSSKDSKGIPISNSLPVLGDITGNAGMEDNIVELVILIRVRITRDDEQDNNLQSAADIRLQRFVPDPRPF